MSYSQPSLWQVLPLQGLSSPSARKLWPWLDFRFPYQTRFVVHLIDIEMQMQMENCRSNSKKLKLKLKMKRMLILELIMLSSQLGGGEQCTWGVVRWRCVLEFNFIFESVSFCFLFCSLLCSSLFHFCCA